MTSEFNSKLNEFLELPEIQESKEYDYCEIGGEESPNKLSVLRKSSAYPWNLRESSDQEDVGFKNIDTFRKAQRSRQDGHKPQIMIDTFVTKGTKLESSVSTVEQIEREAQNLQIIDQRKSLAEKGKKPFEQLDFDDLKVSDKSTFTNENPSKSHPHVSMSKQNFESEFQEEEKQLRRERNISKRRNQAVKVDQFVTNQNLKSFKRVDRINKQQMKKQDMLEQLKSKDNFVLDLSVTETRQLKLTQINSSESFMLDHKSSNLLIDIDSVDEPVKM